MRTRWATAAGLLVQLLLGGWGLAEPPGHAGNDPFTIVNENTGKCIKPLNDWIVAEDCDSSEDKLWKWVSQHRLFHLQSQKCLGIDISRSSDALRMFGCDSSVTLWWKCEHRFLYGAAQYKLALKDGHAVASTNSSDSWKKGGSEEGLCEQPYREIYTSDGNSYGRPCEFPFLADGTWYHECILDGKHRGLWCATTLNYEEDQKWGICLTPESGCDTNWEKNEQMGSCYQFNTQASLSWKEAYVSCRNQGADLLSISSAAELTYLKEKEDIPRMFWIGLNQLYSARGWEWSDHKPLNFLNWDPDTPGTPTIVGSSCASMNAESGLWQSFSCEAWLPYVCKKPLTGTVELADVWTYSNTHCDAGWQPNNGFCYRLVNESDSWDNARKKCKDFSGELISIHSLADVEVVVTKLHNGDTKEEIWTGLKNTNTPTLFQWSDGTEVTLTYWSENQPNVSHKTTPNCVSYSGKLGQWKVQSCEEKLKYVCKKKGEKVNDTDSEKICPPDEGWKRHGEACYKIYKEEVPFGTKCNLTITSRFEQEYLNDMIKKYTKSQNKYFWTGLRDTDKHGEYSWSSVGGRKRALSFSNWNYLEPAFPGGCVAMSSARSLGKWEVKDCNNFRALSICKKKSGPAETEEAAPKPKDLPCPEGWRSISSGPFCYKLFHTERIVRKRNWEEAERFCQALGAHLPSFSHADEIREFLHFLMDQFSDQRWLWIGLNKRSPDLQGSWQWSDHTPVSMVTMPNELQQDYDIRDCAAVKAVHRPWRRSWYFHNDREFIYLRPFACDTKLEWVCQIPKGQMPKTPDWYNPERAGIHGPPVIIEGSEYWFVAEPRLNYEEAVLYCASNHSSLATLTSFTGLKAIKNKIANISGDEQKWWLRTIEQSLDHHLLYSRYPWHHFHAAFGEECLSIAAKFWLSDLNKPTDCSTKLPFICEKYNVSSLEKYSPDSAAKIKCSGDWIPFQNKCFLKVKPKLLTFTQASEVCQTYGGTLPSVLSQQEQDFITHLLPGMETTLWIGLRWTAYERINRWTDNRELTYSNFHSLLVGRWLKLPTTIFDEDSHYHCAMMVNIPKSAFVGTWNFTACNEHHTLFLCQKYSEIEDRQNLKNTSETVKYLNNLYKIILKNLTWSDALRECQKDNMHLVSITDPYQQAFLTVQAIQRNSSLWIGLSSQDDELNFGWSDGKRLQFSRWADDSEQLEDCVVLDTDGFWRTSECDAYQPGAICYYPGNETAKEVKPTDSIRCPSPVLNTPWIPFQNSCYNFLIAKNRHTAITREEVHSKCQKLNPKSHILSIRDERENDFVLEQLLHFHYMASWVLLGLTYENNSLMWTDKTMLSYTNWRRGRPAIKDDKFFAGLNIDGLWDIETFSALGEMLYFQQHSILACKIEVVDYKEEYNTTLPQFIPYEDVIYNVIQKKLTWYEALHACSESGGHLASVHDPKGQLFLEDIAKRDGFPLWVGLSSHDGKESDFEWSDGSAFDYIPWKDKVSGGNCVVLDPKGMWRHAKCSSAQDGAICYTLKTPKEVSSYTYSSRCPAAKQNKWQWVQYKGHCYAADQSLHTFTEAKQFCSELDNSAAVVTIKDEDENKFVSKLMRENNNITMRVWLGMIIHSDKTSHWLDGSRVTFVKWADRRKSGSGKCGILLASNETWKNVECTLGYGRVVCKIPLGPDYRGIGITFAVLSILALIIGLIWFLVQRKRSHWAGFFSSVRYEQGVNEDEIMLPTFHD